MDVLKDHNRRSDRGGELVEERPKDSITRLIAVKDVGDIAAKRCSNVDERTERSRGREWIAGTNDYTGGLLSGTAELLNECSLSNSGLSGEEDERTLSRDSPAQEGCELFLVWSAL